MPKTILVLGYGACGREVTKLLSERGDRVIIGQRSKPADLLPNSEHIKIDVLNKTAMVEALKDISGIAEIVVTLGFTYDYKVWGKMWPEAMANIIHLSDTIKARVVFVDNMYMYGPQPTSDPINEDTTLYTGTQLRKPKIRADITNLWLAATKEKGIKFTALRAPDFYGPKCLLSHLGEFVFPPLVQGKSAQVLVPIDTPHDFAYTPDIGRAVVCLIDADDDCYNQVWHVPCAPTLTIRQLIKIASDHLGHKSPSITAVPFFLMGLLGLCSTFMAELKEMGFTWTVPYYVNFNKFRAKFNFEPTPFEVGIVETVKSFQS